MKPNSALDLIPLLGDEQKFREAMKGIFAADENFALNIETGEVFAYSQWWNLNKSLAELAFELRDKVIKENGSDVWWEAVSELENTVGGETPCPECGIKNAKKRWNWTEQAKPEHWIIAALHALELAGKGKK